MGQNSSNSKTGFGSCEQKLINKNASKMLRKSHALKLNYNSAARIGPNNNLSFPTTGHYLMQGVIMKNKTTRV
jgi:hypothetical protein